MSYLVEKLKSKRKCHIQLSGYGLAWYEQRIFRKRVKSSASQCQTLLELDQLQLFFKKKPPSSLQRVMRRDGGIGRTPLKFWRGKVKYK